MATYKSSEYVTWCAIAIHHLAYVAYVTTNDTAGYIRATGEVAHGRCCDDHVTAWKKYGGEVQIDVANRTGKASPAVLIIPPLMF